MKIEILKLISYGLIGSVGLVIDFGVTWYFREKCGINEYIANAIGFVFAVINNYLLNKFLTFRNYTPISTIQVLTFIIISLIGLSLNSVFLYMLHRWLKLSFYWSKLLSIGIVFAWNFGINSLITFNY